VAVSYVADLSYYDDDGGYEDAQRTSDYDDEDDANAWPYVDDNDGYDGYDGGRPKRGDDDLLYEADDADRAAVRELLAERAAEEARQALVEYLTAGEPSYSVDEPLYLVDPSAEDLALEEDEYNELMSEEPDAYDEDEVLPPEKRFYPYSYEPYGGRWGALVPGSKRGDRDPYDRLYRLADLLSRPAGTDAVNPYDKK